MKPIFVFLLRFLHHISTIKIVEIGSWVIASRPCVLSILFKLFVLKKGLFFKQFPCGNVSIRYSGGFPCRLKVIRIELNRRIKQILVI